MKNYSEQHCRKQKGFNRGGQTKHCLKRRSKRICKKTKYTGADSSEIRRNADYRKTEKGAGITCKGQACCTKNQMKKWNKNFQKQKLQRKPEQIIKAYFGRQNPNPTLLREDRRVRGYGRDTGLLYWAAWTLRAPASHPAPRRRNLTSTLALYSIRSRGFRGWISTPTEKTDPMSFEL